MRDQEKFLTLFNQLKKQMGGSPQRLRWSAENSPHLRRLACLLADLTQSIERTKASTTGKQIFVPKGFISAWREYHQNYSDIVQSIRAAEDDKEVQELLEKLEKITDTDNAHLDSSVTAFWRDQIHRNPGHLFDPLTDNVSQLVGHIYSTFEDVADSRDNDDLVELDDKAKGAWTFFKESFGINPEAIYGKWQQLPDLLIPTHVLRVQSDALLHYYNEAVRSYLLGNSVAAICLCRSILENLLFQYYKIEAEDLEEAINILESRTFRFRKLRLQKKRQQANRLLHESQKRNFPSDTEVIEFLKAVQELIKSVPPKSPH